MTDIGDAANSNGNAEILIPGCHSDVGGGYVTGDNDFSLTKFARAPFLTLPMDCVDSRSVVTQPLNKQTLLDMGWIRDSDIYRESFDKTTVSVRRHVFSGYSNIPLKMMSIRTELKTKRTTFNSIPLRYRINMTTYGNVGTQLLSKAEKATGRQVYYPGGSYTSPTYVKLRQYLHFSAKNDIGFDPSYDGYLFCRYLYHGNQGDNTRHFLHEYT